MTEKEMLYALAQFFRLSFAENAAFVAEEIEGMGLEIDPFIEHLNKIVPPSEG